MPPKRPKAKQAASAPLVKKAKKDETTQTGKGKKNEQLVSAGKEQVKTSEAATDVQTVPVDGKAKFLGQFLVENGWKSALQTELASDYFKKLETELQNEYLINPGQVFPPVKLIFSALNMTPFGKVKVVILGQDPYHDDGQAHGLSFSVPVGVTVPPSLRNIYKELHKDIPGFNIPTHGCLENWAKQGVLLLNAVLTVRAHQPNSHSKIGWQQFTDAIISAISTKSSSGCVFILWGGFAQKKEKLIDTKKHHVIKAAHPSPLSFNKFFGCQCFSMTNKALKQMGLTPVDWSL